MPIFIYILLFGMLCSPLQMTGQLQANSYVYQPAKVHIQLIEGWQVEENDQVSIVQHEGGELSLSLSVLDAEKIEEALMDLESIMNEQLSDPSIIETPEIIEINGMQGVALGMQGFMKGMQVQVGLFLIERPQKVLLVLGIGEKTTLTQYEDELNKIIKSIKPLN